MWASASGDYVALWYVCVQTKEMSVYWCVSMCMVCPVFPWVQTTELHRHDGFHVGEWLLAHTGTQKALFSKPGAKGSGPYLCSLRVKQGLAGYKAHCYPPTSPSPPGTAGLAKGSQLPSPSHSCNSSKMQIPFVPCKPVLRAKAASPQAQPLPL